MTIAKSIECLERRKQYLSERIKEGKSRGKDLTYDRQERAALKKAIEVMKEYLAHGLDYDELVEVYHRSLRDETFGGDWRDDPAPLTEEERRILG